MVSKLPEIIERVKGAAAGEMGWIILGNVASSEVNCKAILLSGGDKDEKLEQQHFIHSILIPAIKETKNPSLQHAALGCLRNLCVSAIGKQTLAQPITDALNQMISNPDEPLMQDPLILLVLIIYRLIGLKNVNSVPSPVIHQLSRWSLDEKVAEAVYTESSRILFRLIERVPEPMAILNQDRIVNCRFPLVREERGMALERLKRHEE